MILSSSLDPLFLFLPSHSSTPVSEAQVTESSGPVSSGYNEHSWNALIFGNAPCLSLEEVNRQTPYFLTLLSRLETPFRKRKKFRGKRTETHGSLGIVLDFPFLLSDVLHLLPFIRVK